jgi:hypothetical protein
VFFQDMRSRSSGDLLLVASDGAPVTIKAIEGCFPARRVSAAWLKGIYVYVCVTSLSRTRQRHPNCFNQSVCEGDLRSCRPSR